MTPFEKRKLHIGRLFDHRTNRWLWAVYSPHPAAPEARTLRACGPDMHAVFESARSLAIYRGWKRDHG